MILSDKVATMLDEAFFSVLLAGIIAPDATDLETPVYLDKLFVYYEIRKRRIKAALGMPLFVDVADIYAELTKVPKITLHTDESVSVLINGIKLNKQGQKYCIYTTWEQRKGKLALILSEENSLMLDGMALSAVSGYSYPPADLLHYMFDKNNKEA